MSRVAYRIGGGLIVISLPLALWTGWPWLTFVVAGVGQLFVIEGMRKKRRRTAQLARGRAVYGRQRQHGHRHLTLAH